MEPIARRESYKALDLRVQQIKVDEAELGIDPDSGKTMIDLHIQITFQAGIRSETLYYTKDNRKLKALARELRIQMTKIKYLDRD